MAKQAEGSEELRADLEKAIDRGEFRLEFQPVVRLGGGQVAGAEALVRWRHPRRGTIAPNDFLPLAEQSGLIDSIGEFVLDQAARAAVTWPRTNDRPGFVSVNVMPNQLRKAGAATRMLHVIVEAGLEPTLMTVELTSGISGDASTIVAAL